MKQLLTKAYGNSHAAVIGGLRRLPISSRFFGPPKGIIRGVKSWVEEYSNVSDQCGYDIVREASRVSYAPPRSLTPRNGLFEEERRNEQPEAFVARIPWARIVMRTGIVISPDDRVFEESCSWGSRFTPNDIEYNTLRSKLRPKKLRGHYLIISSRSQSSYYHWYSECLTRLAVARNYKDVPILISKDLNAWQRESLELLGVNRSRLVEVDEECYEVESLLFASFPGRTGLMSDWAFAWLRDRFRGAVPSRPGKRIYIGRQAVAHRKVSNEAALISALAPLGFTPVEGYSLKENEKIALMRDAEIVVGIHGAGMTNILFAPQGATVIEILDPEHLVGCYYSMAAGLGHEYWCLLGENVSRSAGTPVRKGFDDIRVSIDGVLETIGRSVEAASTPTAQRGGETVR